MSFLIDPPWLYANGRAYAGFGGPPGAPAKVLGAATIAAFWTVSIGLYLDKRWTKPIWRACRAQSGRDWMLNSGVLRLDHEHAGPGTHAVSALLFATYPYWLWKGYKDGHG